jgi:pimeloyl-ACP methyl ester carboxylesterase
MKENYISVNNITLHYIEEGEGKLVILLHGFPDFWYGWRKQIPVLSKKYRVVAPDMRGFNLSDKPRHPSDYRIDILVSDIAELIKKLGAKEAIVVGHDWGGVVAWALAAYYPKLVRKLVILNMPHPRELIKALCRGNLAQWKKSYYIFLFQIPKIPEWIIGKDLAKFFKKVFKKMSPYSADTISDVTIKKYADAYSKPYVLTSAINYYREAFRAIGRMRLKIKSPLPMPVLLIWGEKDPALGKELSINAKQYCINLEIIYDSESGHFIQLDNPELINKKLLEFFEK